MSDNLGTDGCHRQAAIAAKSLTPVLSPRASI